MLKGKNVWAAARSGPPSSRRLQQPTDEAQSSAGATTRGLDFSLLMNLAVPKPAGRSEVNYLFKLGIDDMT